MRPFVLIEFTGSIAQADQARYVWAVLCYFGQACFDAVTCH